MKKTIVLFSSLMASVLVADNGLRTEVEVTAAYDKFDSESLIEKTPLFGVRATFYETEVNRYGLRVGYEGMMGVNYERGSVKETDIHRLFTDIVVEGDEEYAITPYLFLGLGYEYLSDEITGEPSQGYGDLGIGFKYHISDEFTTSLETSVIGKFDTRDIEYKVGLALGYVFGNSYHTVQAPIVALGDKHIADKIVPKELIRQTAIQQPRTQETMQTPVAQPYYQSDKYTAIKITSQERTASAYAVPREENVYDTQPAYDTQASSGAYYVQMASYEVTNPQKLMDSLMHKGYDNVITHQRDASTLVLVGPYMSRTEANRAKRNLKHIKRDAFLYVMP